jgi:DNA-directed RNA polymerase subunit RPC12/RpoP
MAGLIAGIVAGLLIIVSVLSGGAKSNYSFCARCDEYLGGMGPTACPICGSKRYMKLKRG